MSETGERRSVPLQRPKRTDSYEVIARSQKVNAEWIEFANQVANECARVYATLESDPENVVPGRQHPLHGDSGKGTFEGQTYVRWQIDVTSGGRVWYFVDPTPSGKGQHRRAGRVIIDRVHIGHPKSTERKRAGKRHPGRS